MLSLNIYLLIGLTMGVYYLFLRGEKWNEGMKYFLENGDYRARHLENIIFNKPKMLLVFTFLGCLLLPFIVQIKMKKIKDKNLNK